MPVPQSDYLFISTQSFWSLRYLERELRNIRDPYEVAIVAYALSVSNSVEKEAAFNQLDRIKREESE